MARGRPFSLTSKLKWQANKRGIRKILFSHVLSTFSRVSDSVAYLNHMQNSTPFSYKNVHPESPLGQEAD